MPIRQILMGDIVGSRTYPARSLQLEFQALLSSCNEAMKGDILSPYTITLGDEFQGVATSLRGLLRSIFYLEETRLKMKLSFRLRYVAISGNIETPINRLTAHGMLGPGLTRARKVLSGKGRGLPHFRFECADEVRTKQLNRLFIVIEGLTGRWKVVDSSLILDMLNYASNTEVGKLHEKTRSQIWKRRGTLLIEEYRATKEAILELAR